MVKLLDWNVFSQTCTLENIETGDEVKLPPRTMDVLKHLIDAQGQVVSSAELLDRFWSKSVNSDHAVHNAIAELRAALGDEASNPTYIKTYPKRGYALIVRPEFKGEADNTANVFPYIRFSPAPVRYRNATILVLGTAILVSIAGYFLQRQLGDASPDVILVRSLESINVDPDKRFWADQLPSSLVTQLSKIPNTVIVSGFGDVTAEDYVQANFQDDIDYVLGGNIQQANETLRLQINLLSITDNSVVISDQFDISSSQVFDVHDEIGRSIVSALSIYLDDGQFKEMQDWGTSNPFAYSHFLEAGFYASNSNHNDLNLAIEHYFAATEEDPSFINAHIGLVRAASFLSSYSHQSSNDVLHTLINDAIREVSRIDPEHESLLEMRNYLLRLEAGSKSLVEETLKEQILSGRGTDFVYSRYATLLAEARLYKESAQFLSLMGEDEPFQIPHRSTWVYQTIFDTPDNLIQTQKRMLLERPDHIGIISALIRGLAFVGDFDQAVYYLQRQMEIDEEGPFTMLSHAIISGLWGSSIDLADQLEQDNISNPDFNLSHGVKSFILGDLDSGISFWQALNNAERRRLAILAHKVEMYFPDSVLESPRYHSLLEDLNMGVSWQRHLMESLQTMSSVTGITLSAESIDAYETNEFLLRNNLWNHSQISYPNRDGVLYIAPPRG